MMDKIERDGIVVDGRKLIFHYRSFYNYLTLISVLHLEFVEGPLIQYLHIKFLDLFNIRFSVSFISFLH